MIAAGSLSYRRLGFACHGRRIDEGLADSLALRTAWKGVIAFTRS